jgi:hypothetical protein
MQNVYFLMSSLNTMFKTKWMGKFWVKPKSSPKWHLKPEFKVEKIKKELNQPVIFMNSKVGNLWKLRNRIKGDQ